MSPLDKVAAAMLVAVVYLWIIDPIVAFVQELRRKDEP